MISTLRTYRLVNRTVIASGGDLYGSPTKFNSNFLPPVDHFEVTGKAGCEVADGDKGLQAPPGTGRSCSSLMSRRCQGKPPEHR
jgi:hypothetical protein